MSSSRPMPGATKKAGKRRSVIRQLTEEESLETARCPSCDRSDEADKWMVQCDLCERWFHFSCVRVDESVKDRSFACVACALQHGRKSTRSLASSASSVWRRLELQRLEEEKELQEMLLVEQAAAEAVEEMERIRTTMQERLEIAKRYLNKKYEVLQEEEQSNDGRSRKSRSSSRSKLSDVQNWVEKHDMALVTGSGMNEVPIGSTPVTAPEPKATATGSSGGGVHPITSSQSDVLNQHAVLPQTLPTTSGEASSTPVHEGHVSRTADALAAARISPLTSSQPGGPLLSNMSISPLPAEEKSRAELERELQELQQQLINLKRSAVSQHSSLAPGSSSSSDLVTTRDAL